MLCVISRKPSRITDAMHFASQGTAYKEDPQASSTHTASRPQTQTQQQLRLWLPRVIGTRINAVTERSCPSALPLTKFLALVQCTLERC